MFTLLWLTTLAYLLGSLPFGVWVGYAVSGRDIRAGGSGHTGATNTVRQAGWWAGALVMVLDVGKGFAAEWLAVRFGATPLTWMVAGAAVVLGHCWPLFARFRGGSRWVQRGLGTVGGVMLAVYPLGVALGIGLAAAGSLLLRHTARGNILGGLLFGPVVWLFTRSPDVAGVAAAAGLVVAVRSLADWRRVYREVWLDRERTADERG